MALEKINNVKGKAVFVPGNDIDTDRIIPARFMVCVTFEGLGKYAFYDERKNADGTDQVRTDVKVVYLTGPLFFGTQDQLTQAMAQLGDETHGVIFSVRGVPYIDESAISELETLLADLRGRSIRVMFSGVQPNVKHEMERTGFAAALGEENFAWDAIEAIETMEQLPLVDTPVQL